MRKSLRSRMYWNAMFQGETGDYVKNLLTDGQWKPKESLAVRVVGYFFAVIICLALIAAFVALVWWVW